MAADLSIFSNFFLLDPFVVGDQTLLALEPIDGEIQADGWGEPPVSPVKFLPQWRPGRIWRRRSPDEKKKAPDHTAMAQEFLRTGVIDSRRSQQLEAYIYAKADALASGPKKWNPTALLELSVLAEALANHISVNRVDRILFKLAQTLQIYFSVVGWRGTKIDKQLIQEQLAFLKEGASAALASGNFERAFHISLALFHQAQGFLQWAKKAEEPTIQREALEARLWVKLFVAKIAQHPKMEEQDIELEVDAFLTSFALDVDAMTNRLRRLAYEKEKNALPSTDRLVAKALGELAEYALSQRDRLMAVRYFQDLASFQTSSPHSFSPCAVAMNRLKAAKVLAEIYGPYEEDVVQQLKEATEALRKFDSKKSKPFTANPITLAPWQIDCLKQAWLDLKLTIMARPEGLEVDSREIRTLLANLSSQMAQGFELLEKLADVALQPNIGLQFRRYDKISTLILRLAHWVREGANLLLVTRAEKKHIEILAAVDAILDRLFPRRKG